MTLTRPPSDGIRASQRPGGWLARHWRASLKPLELTHGPIVSRGRTMARGGRVRNLWFSPGMAGADVVDRNEVAVTIRFRPLEDEEWDLVHKTLLGRLDFIAALMEGELPRELLSALDEQGLKLLPSWRRTWGRGAHITRDVDCDCDCDDAWRMPCPHAAAVYALVADALDGDPFLLLTLRGRSRPQLLAHLRAGWGDDEPLVTGGPDGEEAPPTQGSDWFASPVPLPPPRFSFSTPETQAAGLRALGPPPGGDNDLFRALLPIYEAGAKAASELVYDEDPASPPPTPTPAPLRRVAAPRGEKRFTEKLVELLERMAGARTTDLAEHLGVPVSTVRRELIELEEAGLVAREGRTRGTRWQLQ